MSLILGSPQQRTDYSAFGSRVVPPYPGNSIVPLARPPTAERFPWHLSMECRIDVALRMYEGAGKLLYREAPIVRIPPSNKTFLALTSWLNLAQMFEVEPLVWMFHSLHRWNDASRPAPYPSYAWLFSLKRLEAQAEDVRPLWGQLRPLLPAPSRPHSELLALWQQMDRALATERPDSCLSVEAIVARFFPGDAYDRMVANARAAAFAEQRRMESQAREGYVFWTL